jgi:hypothetical protein
MYVSITINLCLAHMITAYRNYDDVFPASGCSGP